mgnify:CR=1 FL=1
MNTNNDCNVEHLLPFQIFGNSYIQYHLNSVVSILTDKHFVKTVWFYFIVLKDNIISTVVSWNSSKINYLFLTLYQHIQVYAQNNLWICHFLFRVSIDLLRLIYCLVFWKMYLCIYIMVERRNTWPTLEWTVKILIINWELSQCLKMHLYLLAIMHRHFTSWI